MSNLVKLLSVGELNEMKDVFTIPAMQRGYRWTGAEIERLLNDLASFARDGDGMAAYCLQPIVLSKRDGVLRILDGQQRLTTIRLICEELKLEMKWSLVYETGVDEGLLNQQFKKEASWAIQQWCKKHGDDATTIKGLLSARGAAKQVVFVWYQVELGGDEGMENDIFRRLNSGKTPLTDSELIRALYMVKRDCDLSDDEKMEIAKEWEMIEAMLRDDDFWRTFYGRESVSFTRIDVLFKQVAPGEDSPFSWMESELERAADVPVCLRGYWAAVLACYNWMRAVYEDPIASQLMGWLAHFGGTFNPFGMMEGNGSIQALRGALWARVKEKIGWGNGSARTFINTFDYNENKPRPKLFVLLNIAFLCNSHASERFSFAQYDREQGWDIEHIDSSHANDLSKEKDRDAWVNGLCEYFGDDRRLQELKGRYEEAKRNANNDEQSTAFKNLVACAQGLEAGNGGEKESGCKSQIGNLTLLNQSINRSYGNAIFPVKRQRIHEEIERGAFIPPLTRYLFMKFFSEKATSPLTWNAQDQEDYQENLVSILKHFDEQQQGGANE